MELGLSMFSMDGNTTLKIVADLVCTLLVLVKELQAAFVGPKTTTSGDCRRCMVLHVVSFLFLQVAMSSTKRLKCCILKKRTTGPDLSIALLLG